MQDQEINQSAEISKLEYLERVNALFDQCEHWSKSKDPSVRIERGQIELDEEPVGRYLAPILKIRMATLEEVSLIPRGRWIIGADGRVDLTNGSLRETLIYLPIGGYSLSYRVTTDSGEILSEGGNAGIVSESSLEGWHYVQSRHLKFYPLLDKELFFRLLEVLGR